MKYRMPAIWGCIFLVFIMAASAAPEPAVSQANKPQTGQNESHPRDGDGPATTNASQLANPYQVGAGYWYGAQPGSADVGSGYQIPWQSVNGGGIDLHSGGYRIASSVGQSAIGITRSCNCGLLWGDVNNDGWVDPIDFFIIADYYYKSVDCRVYPPGWNCSRLLGDVNCDGSINPIDVVRYVNYVYQNINSFCPDPCAP